MASPVAFGGFLNGLRPRCGMGSLASKHSLLAPCPWTLSPAHSAAIITRFGRRQALAAKPLVPCAMFLVSWRYNNSSA